MTATTLASSRVRQFIGLLLGAVLVLAIPASVMAAGDVPGASGIGSGPIFVAQIVLLLLIGRGLGEAMQRLGEPSIMGQLLAGILLGPSLFGAIWPQGQQMVFPSMPEQKSMIDAFAQFGILMLLLLTGMETDLKLVRKVRRAAISVSIAGVSIPFACGFALGELLPESMVPDSGQRIVMSLFLGTALSISSVKIVAAVVREMDFMRRNVGQVIVASAIMEDTIGWVIVAITLGLAHGQFAFSSVASSVLGAGLFLLFSFTLGRRLVFALIRWFNDTFVSEFSVITVILIIMGLMALITHLIGVHTVLGAFIAGVLVGESPILTRHIEAQLRGLIVALFMPVFFGVAGLNADLTILKDPQFLLLTVGLILVASVGKFAGAFVGGMLGGLKFRESLAIANGMNARGSTEVIVASIGLSMGALSQELFTMIVAMALITTMAMPPALRRALARLPMSMEERERLEREATDAKRFVPNLERLLLAVDASPNGKFASYLAGLIAGFRGAPTTALHIEPKLRSTTAQKERTEVVVEQIETAASKAVEQSEAADEDDKPRKVEVISRNRQSTTQEAIASEASKGYDMLVIGIGQSVDRNGGFSMEIEKITAEFDGPLAIVLSPTGRADLANGSRILVPVNGTELSRRAAEVAFALARPTDARVSALYVSNESAGDAKQSRRKWRSAGSRRDAEAVLKDLVNLAERFTVEVQTELRVNANVARAILKEADRDDADLIVMGAGRRAGSKLFFGDTAAAVLRDSKRA